MELKAENLSSHPVSGFPWTGFVSRMRWCEALESAKDSSSAPLAPRAPSPWLTSQLPGEEGLTGSPGMVANTSGSAFQSLSDPKCPFDLRQEA